MALIHCPECDKEISEKATACPNCGYPITEANEEECADGALHVEPSENTQPAKSTKRKVIIAAITGTCLIVLAAILMMVLFSAQGLSGDDKEAFDVLMKAADDFKDPSSVRLVSGSFDDGGILCCAISATNDFGARVTSYYRIYSSGYCSETNYPDYSYKATAFLDIEKINDKLEKELSSYD